MRKLSRLQDLTEELEMQILQAAQESANASLMAAQLATIVRPKADITRLELDKKARTAADQMAKSAELSTSVGRLSSDISKLDTDIRDLVAYLDNHGRERTSAVSLTTALNQAAEILRQIQARDFSEVDIRTRTEMSEARILYDSVEKMLYGSKVELASIRQQTEKVDLLVTDLLQYINDGMASVNEVATGNLHNNQSLVLLKAKCASIEEKKRSGGKLVADSVSMAEKSGAVVAQSREFFAKMGSLLASLKARAGELESREMGLSGVVEDYRTRFVFPCQANAEKLYSVAQKVAALFENRAGRITVEQALQAANAYRRIVAALDEARTAALNALDAALLAAKVADPPAGREKSLGRRAETSRQRSEDLRQEAQGLWKNADDMSILTRSIKLDMEKYAFDLEKKKRLSADLQAEMKRHSYVSEYATAARQSASKALKEAGEANRKTDAMAEKIRLELRSRANELNSFSAEELGNIPRKLTESQRTLQKVEKQAVYMEHRSRDLVSLNKDVASRLASLRSRIDMARHAASNIHISITGGEGGACLRSYAVELTPSTHNEISLIYGIDTDERNAMLVFLPGGGRRGRSDGSVGGDFDFLALEMVDRKIRFVWNLGSGTQTITHIVEIETAYRLDRQDTMWYKITAERIGNIGRLNVRKVRPKYDLPAYHQWVVGESPATTNVLDVGPSDKLWVGGTPNYYKTDDLLSLAGSDGRFNGVIYQLTVDKRRIGLWDFVTSFGCRETYSGVTDAVSQHSCHSFSGDGYATQNQIRNYDPRYYAVSLEFRTFDLNALLILVAHHGNGQYLALQLVDGRVGFRIQYGPNVTLDFMSRNTYNSGQWVKIEAGRAYRKVAMST